MHQKKKKNLVPNIALSIFELHDHHEKTNILHMRKQRRRSA